MLRLILIETRLLLRDRWALALLTVLIAACALAFASGRALMSDQIDGRAASAAEDGEALDGFRERLADADLPPEEAILSPYRMRLGIMAPLPPLADFSAGRAVFDNYSTIATMRSRPDTLFKRTQTDNPELLMRGRIDLGFVAVILAPLLLVGLGYGLFAADRDSGTAKLILVQAGSARRLIVARLAPRLLAIASPIGLAGLALLLAGPDIAGRWSAAGWWAMIAAALLLTWAAAIAWVNSLKITAETAALSLVAGWAVLTLVLPAAISAAMQAAYPPPSRFEQIASARAAEVASTEAYENDHPDLASEDVAGRLASIRKTWAIAQRVDAAIAPLNLRFEQQLEAQQRFASGLAWLSPTMIAGNAMERASGTDAGTASAFRTATREYLDSVLGFGGGFIDRGEAMDATHFATIPRFSWQPAPTAPIVPLIVLALLAVGFSIIALRRYGRVDLS